MTSEENIMNKLAEAKRLAEDGKASTMERYLETAQRYAKIVGQDISDKVAQIEDIGYERAISPELAEARRLAEDGKASIMECYVKTQD